MIFPTDAELDELILGPESVAWRATSDLRLYFGMLYPLLLQVAHPTVDAGVGDFSEFERRPWDRLLRTVDYVSVVVYGGREAAASGRRLRAYHRRFHGTRGDGSRYSALEPAAYAWVHATLVDTYVRANARLIRPLEPNEIERFYREYRGLGRLIGIRDRDLPPSWPAFRAYFQATADSELTRTRSVERVLAIFRNVAAPPTPMPGVMWRAIRIPAARALWLGGVGLMDSGLRRRLGIGWNPLDAAQFRVLGMASKAVGPVMPDSLKVMGPEHLRWRRREIEHGPLGSPGFRPG